MDVDHILLLIILAAFFIICSFCYVLCCNPKRRLMNRMSNSNTETTEGDEPWHTDLPHPYIDYGDAPEDGDSPSQFVYPNNIELYLKPPKYALEPPTYDSLFSGSGSQSHDATSAAAVL